MNSRNKLAAVVGPTAVGKTAFAIELAKALKAEIISFDSRQFYRELRIGSAMPSAREQQEIPHHFIADRSVKAEINAGVFATEALDLIQRQPETPFLLVGGSGLYLKALTDGFDAIPAVPNKLRLSLNERYRSRGLTWLQEEVAQKDPDHYERVDRKNPQRLLRALEIFEHTGKKLSSYQQKQRTGSKLVMPKVGLSLERPILYERINQRVEIMLKQGLLAEAKSLISERHRQSLQTVGYRELFQYFDQNLSLAEAVSEIQKNSRRYAKRQLTWFRRDPEIKWFGPSQIEAALHYLRPFFS